jgi:hypothetical protein
MILGSSCVHILIRFQAGAEIRAQALIRRLNQEGSSVRIRQSGRRVTTQGEVRGDSGGQCCLQGLRLRITCICYNWYVLSHLTVSAYKKCSIPPS